MSLSLDEIHEQEVGQTLKMHSAHEHTPTRTCVACRLSASPEAFERFVLMGDQLVYDLRHRAPGRGAHVHVACLEQAHKRQAFARSFKAKVVMPPLAELTAQLREGIGLRLREQISAAAAQRQLALGGQELAEAMRLDQIALVLFASDCGESTRKKFEGNAARKGVPTQTGPEGASLGQLVGRAQISVLGVRADRVAQKIVRDLEKLRDLGVFGP